ncbi:MAG: type II toxin-antitoxin system Phd/YefM family antitoxin [Pyrinomonadaceae bacterium]|nr:type II toxin-antitoxin system Phd/YefM family antitoxin [Pyrinomonadaceae bacterium]
MSHNVKQAKNNLSTLIKLAEKGQPQVIRRHDKEVAVVVSIEDWKKAGGKRKTLLEIFQGSGLKEILPYLEDRPDDPPREVIFE